jgi:hypothetical protein
MTDPIGVTRNLSAAEALQKAKSEGGFARCESARPGLAISYRGDSFMQTLTKGGFTSVYGHAEYTFTYDILEPWEHHPTSDTL